MANLVDLTKRVASVPGRIASNVGGVVKGSVMRNTGINQITPSNIFAATLEAAGLDALIPATLMGPSGGGKTVEDKRREKEQTAKAAGGGGSNIEGVMRELLDVQYRILNTSREILQENKEQTKSLQDVVAYFKKRELTDIEDKRERARPAPAPQANAAPKQDKKGGLFGSIGDFLSSALSGIKGFLSTLSSLFSGILKILPSIIEAASTLFGFIGRFAKTLLGFLGRFAGPIAAVVAVLLALEEQDWTAFFKKFTDAWDAFLKGDWLTGIVNIVTAIPELLIKGLGRILAKIVDFFGFTNAAKAINEWLDNFDLAKTIIDGLKYIGNLVVDGFNAVKDTFTKFWNSFNIIDPIVDAFTYVKDLVVNFFGSVKDAVGNVISGAADVAGNIGTTISNMVSSVWNFFKAIPAKIGEMISSIIPAPLKDLWNKVFGSSKTEAAPAPSATPTPATPGPQANVNQNTQVTPGGPGQPTFVNNETEIRTGGQQSTIQRAIQRNNEAAAAQTPAMQQQAPQQPGQQSQILPVNRLMPLGSQEARTNAIAKVLAQTPENLGGTNVKETPAFKAVSEEVERQQKANEAARLGMEQNNQGPIVVNNNTNQSQSAPSQGGSKENRTSGAALTAPVQSHMDRALYGSGFGAGVP